MRCTSRACRTLHPRSITEGWDLARVFALTQLEEKFKIAADVADEEFLLQVARTSLRTKVDQTLADSLASMVTTSVLTVRRDDKPVDGGVFDIPQECTAADKIVRPKKLTFVRAQNV